MVAGRSVGERLGGCFGLELAIRCRSSHGDVVTSGCEEPLAFAQARVQDELVRRGPERVSETRRKFTWSEVHECGERRQGQVALEMMADVVEGSPADSVKLGIF